MLSRVDIRTVDFDKLKFHDAMFHGFVDDVVSINAAYNTHHKILEIHCITTISYVDAECLH